MAANIITIEDLDEFKEELLKRIEKLLSERQSSTGQRWLKSRHVQRILTISCGTLKALRAKGILPFSKVGGVIYYDVEDIEKLLMDNKHHPASIANKKLQP